MIIYLEYIFFENLIMNFIILKETIELAKIRFDAKRVIIAAGIASVYVVLMLILKIKGMNLAISKIMLALSITYIATLPKTIEKYIKYNLLFFLISIINVGTYTTILNIFNLKMGNGLKEILIYIATYYISRSFLVELWKIYKVNLNRKELIYDVEFKLDGKQYDYTGFLDTGNTVQANGLPIIFAEITDEKQIEKLANIEKIEIKAITLGNVCVKQAYILEDIKIKKDNKEWRVKAGVVFENRKISRWNHYNLILNYVLYTDVMGGIRL